MLKSKSGPLVCLVLKSKFWKQLATKYYIYWLYLFAVSCGI